MPQTVGSPSAQAVLHRDGWPARSPVSEHWPALLQTSMGRCPDPDEALGCRCLQVQPAEAMVKSRY